MLYKSQWEAISDLEDKYLGQLMRAIYEYQITGKEPEKHDIIYRDFKHFKAQFNIDDAKYQGVLDRNAENGKRGGRPKKPTESEKTQSVLENPKNPVGFLKPKKADNDNDNVNDNDLYFNTVTSPDDEGAGKKKSSRKKVKPTKAEVISFYGEQKSISLNTPLSPDLVAAAAAAGWRGGEPETRAKLATGYAEVVDYMMLPSDMWPEGMWRCVLTKTDQLEFVQFCKLVLNYGMTRAEIKEYLNSWENIGYKHSNLYATMYTWKNKPDRKPTYNGKGQPLPAEIKVTRPSSTNNDYSAR